MNSNSPHLRSLHYRVTEVRDSMPWTYPKNTPSPCKRTPFSLSYRMGIHYFCFVHIGSLASNSLSRLGWLVSRPQGSSYLYPLSAGTVILTTFIALKWVLYHKLKSSSLRDKYIPDWAVSSGWGPLMYQIWPSALLRSLAFGEIICICFLPSPFLFRV